MSNVSYEETHVRPGISPRRPGRTRWIKHVSWASVFAGVAVALGVQVLLSMLGTGIGMSTIDPLRVGGTPSTSAFSVGAGLWWVVSSFISLVIGGWVAAQFSGYLRHLDGLLHGLLVWALTTLITIYLLGSAISSVVSGAGTVLSSDTRAITETASSVAPWNSIKEDARIVLSPRQEAGARTMDAEFNSTLERFLTVDEAGAKETNRTALINLLVERTDMSVDEAVDRVNSWDRTYQRAVQQAREAADSTAKAISWSALWGFIVVLLSAIAGALGGIVGTPVPDVEVHEEP